MKLQKGSKTANSRRAFVKVENAWKCSVTGARRRPKIAIAILKWRIKFGARSPTVSHKKLYENVSKLTTMLSSWVYCLYHNLLNYVHKERSRRAIVIPAKNTPIRKSILSIKWSVTILENKMSSATSLSSQTVFSSNVDRFSKILTRLFWQWNWDGYFI